MIKIEKLYKKFGKETVLKNIAFEIAKQQTVVVLGPSGGGKSTLLRCIKHLEQPDAGAIYINGLKIKSENDTLLQKIGLVFQNFNLFPHFTVLENLLYAAKFKSNVSHKELQQRADDLLLQFGLAAKALSKPKDLSGGQKQRIAIARALMMEPELLLFDEPTSALDQETTFELVKILQSLKEHMGILIVTHEIRFAKALADRVIFMDQGQILCDQPAEDFFNEPESHRARLFMEQDKVI